MLNQQKQKGNANRNDYKLRCMQRKCELVLSATVGKIVHDHIDTSHTYYNIKFNEQ